MKKSIRITAILLVLLSNYSCDNKSHTELPTSESELNLNTIEMNSYISMFEIPATDLSRAINFYQTILNITIEKMEIPGMEMGIFPYEDQLISVVIIEGEGYTPSPDGLTIYLNGGDNLQPILDKVENNGGTIIVPKTLHGDESGYFALFLDSEGNKIGLHSPN